MNPREEGFLLLTSCMGNPERRVLTVAQMRGLARRVRMSCPGCEGRDLTVTDLVSLGYDREFSRRVIDLLSETELLAYYCGRGDRHGCIPLTRVTPGYPRDVRRKLGEDSPGCLWAKGDTNILNMQADAVVGSRDLREENRKFAADLGRRAAEIGMAVVSGNARGTDQTAQQACLDAGGYVISVVADSLLSHPESDRVLYLSEEGYDLPFSTSRALSRNRVIHALGKVVFVAQCTMEKGGTWSGTTWNLRKGLTPVFCYNDGSPAVGELLQMGASLIDMGDIVNRESMNRFISFFESESFFGGISR